MMLDEFALHVGATSLAVLFGMTLGIFGATWIIHWIRRMVRRARRRQ